MNSKVCCHSLSVYVLARLCSTLYLFERLVYQRVLPRAPPEAEAQRGEAGARRRESPSRRFEATLSSGVVGGCERLEGAYPASLARRLRTDAAEGCARGTFCADWRSRRQRRERSTLWPDSVFGVGAARGALSGDASAWDARARYVPRF